MCCCDNGGLLQRIEKLAAVAIKNKANIGQIALGYGMQEAGARQLASNRGVAFRHAAKRDLTRLEPRDN